jgi:hypothetical protein
MAELSEDEVIEILGPVSDALAAEIIATGIDGAGSRHTGPKDP